MCVCVCAFVLPACMIRIEGTKQTDDLFSTHLKSEETCDMYHNTPVMCIPKLTGIWCTCRVTHEHVLSMSSRIVRICKIIRCISCMHAYMLKIHVHTYTHTYTLTHSQALGTRHINKHGCRTCCLKAQLHHQVMPSTLQPHTNQFPIHCEIVEPVHQTFIFHKNMYVFL